MVLSIIRTMMLALVSLAMFAQPPITISSLTYIAPAPPGVTGASATVVGNQANANYYYWVVAIYSGGKVFPSSPIAVLNAPNVLSGSNYVRLNWNALPNATGYDVIRTSTPVAPNGSCANCAVTTATSATTVNDDGTALGAYTVTSAGVVSTTCTLSGITSATPTLSCSPYNYPSSGGSISSGTLAAIPATCSVGTLYQATDQMPTAQLYVCSSANTWTRIIYTQGTTAPVTCSVGQLFFDTDATAGQNWLGCTSSNTWTMLGGGTITQVVADGTGAFTVTNGTGPVVTIGPNLAWLPGLTIDNAWLGGQNASGASYTAMVAVGAADPATCNATRYDWFLNTTSMLLKVCSATNTWTIVAGLAQEHSKVATTYTLALSDFNKIINQCNVAATAYTLPTTFPNGWKTTVKNTCAGDITFTPTSGTVSGAASVVASIGEYVQLTFDGTNYQAITNRILAGTGIVLTKTNTGVTAAVDTATIATRDSIIAGTDKSCNSTTGNDTYTCTLAKTLTSYTTNMCLSLITNFTNYGAATINVDSVGVKNLYKLGFLGLDDGDIVSGIPAEICYDGTRFIVMNPQNQFPTKVGLDCYEAFLSQAVSTGGNGICMVFTGNVSGSFPAALGEADAQGIMVVGTGSSATATATVATDPTALLFGSGTWTYSARVRIPTLSTVSERFYAQTGFLDTSTVTPTDGCYFRVKDDVNGGRWEAVCRSNSTETATDTGISPVANTWQVMTIVVNAAATSVSFSIDGVASAGGAIVTNIPSGAGRQVGIRPLQITKTVGTTTRTFECDWFRTRLVLTTPNP